MKEDYLWDKSGDDAEIRQLENALRAFRYRETAPPALPQKVLTLEKPSPRRFFRFGFRFGLPAFASLVTVLSLVWFQFGGTVPAVEIVAHHDAPPEKVKTADDSFTTPPVPAPPDFTVRGTTENPPATVRQNIVKIRRTVTPAARHKKANRHGNQTEAPPEALTAEERYAYDQLMLALSITGSQLKIVQDKINGIEDRNAVLKTAK